MQASREVNTFTFAESDFSMSILFDKVEKIQAGIVAAGGCMDDDTLLETGLDLSNRMKTTPFSLLKVEVQILPCGCDSCRTQVPAEEDNSDKRELWRKDDKTGPRLSERCFPRKNNASISSSSSRYS